MAETDLPEEWRVVADFPDYAVSNLGRVRRVTDGKLRNSSKAGQIISPGSNKGYPVVMLYRDGNRRLLGVHTLVCEAFHGPRPSAAHGVAHWDGNRANPLSGNLRWATQAENMADAIRHGRTTRLSGRLSEEAIMEIRQRLATGENHATIAGSYGVSRSVVSELNGGKKRGWLLGGEFAFVTGRARKLTEDDVIGIRRQIAAGARNKALAADFGVSPTTISQIRHGALWRKIIRKVGGSTL